MTATCKRTFSSRESLLLKRICPIYIRFHLESVVAVWDPPLKKDINLIEKVQREVTKFPHDL